MNNKVKETSEELLIKIINFIFESEADELKQNHLLLELAASLVITTIDTNKEIEDIRLDIENAIRDIYCMIMGGIGKYKAGDNMD